jgi:hypothetical protein
LLEILAICEVYVRISFGSRQSFGSRIRKNAGCQPPTRILANAATGYFPLRLPEL